MILYNKVYIQYDIKVRGYLDKFLQHYFSNIDNVLNLNNLFEPETYENILYLMEDCGSNIPNGTLNRCELVLFITENGEIKTMKDRYNSFECDNILYLHRKLILNEIL